MEIPIITKEMPWAERSKYSRQITSGKWQNNKTGRVVEVIGRRGNFTVILKHETGRITHKQDHYFIGDYSTFVD
jgi:hypothetical protein